MITFEGPRYCVYQHWLGEELMYVGCGSLNRPFNLGGRTNTWIRSAEEAKNVRVEIVLLTTQWREASIYERQMIIRLKPTCNKIIPRDESGTMVPYERTEDVRNYVIQKSHVVLNEGGR